jgi:hypothetical protein
MDGDNRFPFNRSIDMGKQLARPGIFRLHRTGEPLHVDAEYQQFRLAAIKRVGDPGYLVLIRAVNESLAG